MKLLPKILLLPLEVLFHFYSKYSYHQYTQITHKNYPVTTHLSQFTQYNPVTQQEVVTMQIIIVCLTNYSLVR